jgi:hypothetical protein
LSNVENIFGPMRFRLIQVSLYKHQFYSTAMCASYYPSVTHYECLINIFAAITLYRSNGRFWPADLYCAVVRRKPASLRLGSMRSDTILPPVTTQTLR